MCICVYMLIYIYTHIYIYIQINELPYMYQALLIPVPHTMAEAMHIGSSCCSCFPMTRAMHSVSPFWRVEPHLRPKTTFVEVAGTMPDLLNIHNILTDTDKYWTSTWSPIGSRWELKTTFRHHFECLGFSRLFGVFENRYKH